MTAPASRHGALSAVLVAVLSFGAMAVAACTTTEGISDAVARAGSAQAGKVAFDRVGHPVDGKLTCESEGASSGLNVLCKGTTQEGEPVTLRVRFGGDSEVTTGSDPRIDKVTATGSVDGEVVFDQSCIGRGC
ncbi:hypothetical protein [Streptomyces sp. URMC 123]|uniref:hypothetical protein n=1 Tax=Streptomyces sp. URMC 123 TaxID=3423403 RepID=UPI003F1B63CD